MEKTYLEYMDAVEKTGVRLMKNTCELQIHSPMGVNNHTVVVKPLEATCATYRHNDEAEYEAIKWAIDFDQWKHSWHHEIKPENYNHFLEIIQGKVIEKSEALVKLNAVANFLQNRIMQLNDTDVATEKSAEQISKEISDYEPF